MFLARRQKNKFHVCCRNSKTQCRGFQREIWLEGRPVASPLPLLKVPNSLEKLKDAPIAHKIR